MYFISRVGRDVSCMLTRNALQMPISGHSGADLSDVRPEVRACSGCAPDSTHQKGVMSRYSEGERRNKAVGTSSCQMRRMACTYCRIVISGTNLTQREGMRDRSLHTSPAVLGTGPSRVCPFGAFHSSTTVPCLDSKQDAQA